MFLIYPVAGLLSMFFAVLTIILSPVLALFVRNNNLPKYLYWFQTFDNDFVTGPVSMGWTPGYVSSVRWLIRNPAYGFDMFLLGCPFALADWKVVKDTPNCFFAYSRWGAFSYKGTWFKWGWKAWARLQGPGAWDKFDKVPITFVR